MNPYPLDPKIIERLKKLAPLAEKAGQLLPEQLEIIDAARWFKIFMPEKYGGLNMSLPDALRLEEALAKIDGSLGWTVTLCAGANLFVGYMQPSLADVIFHHPQVCLGGSGATSGTAVVQDDGYLINGQWKYATGTPHLTHFTANCILTQNGAALTNNDGTPQVRSFVFDKNDVTIIPDWNTMGLKATASNSFSVKNLKAGKEKMFEIDDKNIFINSTIYRYPFLQLAETTITANCLGMAEHFLEEAAHLFRSKLKQGSLSENIFQRMKEKTGQYFCKIDKEKNQFYVSVQTSWQQLETLGRIEPALLEQISCVCKKLAAVCRTAVAEIYPLCGINATENNTPLNHIFRDVFTGSQHALLHT